MSKRNLFLIHKKQRYATIKTSIASKPLLWAVSFRPYHEYLSMLLLVSDYVVFSMNLCRPYVAPIIMLGPT